MNTKRTTVSLQSFAGGPLLWTSAGERIKLARELGRGGEGAVYEVEDKPDHVAKVYLAQISSDRVAKLGAMTGMATACPKLLSFCAWPEATLHDRATNGSVSGTAGFVMHRVVGCHPIHHLTSPTTRKRDYPDRDWSFLVHVARNLAIAVDTIHAAGAVIGDINEGGFLVGQDGRVWVLDCDSFQIQHTNRTYRCEVGIADYTPPELQNIPGGFANVVRTLNHDRFGLAVIVFKLLMMGRHPYMGVFRGQGDPELGQLIQENRFAYGPDAGTRLMSPPPHSLDIGGLGSPVSGLFCHAFGGASLRGGRPDASAWIDALTGLLSGLTTCSTHPGHKHVTGTPCPWCRLEATSGVSFFICGFATTGSWVVDVDALRRKYASIPVIPAESCPESPANQRTGAVVDPGLLANLRTAKGHRQIGYTIAVVIAIFVMTGAGAAGLFVLLVGCLITASTTNGAKRRLTAEINSRANQRDQAKRTWEQCRTTWAAASSGDIQARRRSTEDRLAAYGRIDAEYKAAMVDLDRQKIEDQRQDFLEGIPIRSAKCIHFHITATKIATLESFGISTAAEIDKARIMQIRGFGGRGILADALVDWRDRHLQRFCPNPSRPVDPREIARVRQRLEGKRRSMEVEINRSCAELGAIARACIDRRNQIRVVERKCREQFDQAVANWIVANAAKE